MTNGRIVPTMRPLALGRPFAGLCVGFLQLASGTKKSGHLGRPDVHVDAMTDLQLPDQGALGAGGAGAGVGAGFAASAGASGPS
jgi:hypothetical protein